ncbi:MAG: DNA-processing protein DprA [Clostridia bacterium]
MTTYNDNEKALIMLAQEASSKKRASLLDSVEEPCQLFDNFDEADETIKQLEKIGACAVCLGEKNYPTKLAQIYDPPVALFCRGDISLLNADNSLAIVGTRKPTRYGRDVVTSFAKRFASNGICVISGLARGIDTCAHKEMLDSGGKTIGVMANGIDKIYPPENRELAQQMATYGLIVTEYPIGTSPLAYRFPERNRIISGLSDGVVIPEAGLNSGSLITANCALDQGKELFVVPGSIFSSASAGANKMLQELQGTMVTSPDDILAKFGIMADKPQANNIQLTLEQGKIITMLDDGEMHFADILQKVDMNVGDLSALLSEMEIFGLVKKLSGNYYQNCQLV